MYSPQQAVLDTELTSCWLWPDWPEDCYLKETAKSCRLTSPFVLPNIPDGAELKAPRPYSIELAIWWKNRVASYPDSGAPTAPALS